MARTVFDIKWLFASEEVISCNKKLELKMLS
jgi:hypothetical protein